MASPERLGAVERSPHYAPSLNAEPLACHTDDHQLSAGYREVEPAREKLKGSPLTQLRSLSDSVSSTSCLTS